MAEKRRVRPARGSARYEELLRQRREFIDRVRAGEHYLAVGKDIGVSHSTAWGWVDQAVKSDAIKLADAIKAGYANRPRASPAQLVEKKKIFLDELAKGHNIRHASELAGVSYGTAQKWSAKNRGVVEQIRKKDVPPEPIAWEDLTDEGRSWLENFALFRLHVLKRTWNPPWATMTADKLLELYFTPDDEFAVVNVAPGVGKSTLITHDFIAWAVTLMRAKGMEPTVLLGHRSWQKATWYVKRLRQTFTHNRVLIWTYGRFQPSSKLAAWSTTELLVEPLSYEDLGEKEPTITAGSYDASLLSGRYKIVIWDDLIDKANASSAEQRDATVTWWQQEAETRLEPGGLLVLSNARYGPEDLSWFVTTQVDDEDLDDAGDPRPLYHRIRYAVHDDSKCDGENHSGPWPDGCLLDPVRASYKRIRRFMVQDEGRFRLVWQQEDTDPAGNLAQKVWFTGGLDSFGALAPGCFRADRMFGQRLDESTPLLSAVTVDPSGKKRWAVGHWLAYPEGRHYLYRCENRPMQAPELLYREEDGTYTGILEDWWILSKDEGVPFTYLIIENKAAQDYLLQYEFFRSWCASRGVACIPHDTNRSNKADPDRGVQMLGPVYRHGRVVIPYGGHAEKVLGDAFQREACAWPEGASTDLVMHHWFLVHRLDALIVTEIAADAEGSTEHTAPAFARNRRAPRFARARLDRSGRVAS